MVPPDLVNDHVSKLGGLESALCRLLAEAAVSKAASFASPSSSITTDGSSASSSCGWSDPSCSLPSCTFHEPNDRARERVMCAPPETPLCRYL